MNYVPEFKKDLFVENDLTDFLSKIFTTSKFFPILLVGPTGSGKTFPVRQLCAKMKRECIQVNVTRRSNEDNLMGSFRLVDGNTIFEKGPVVIAMERGSVLLLDELDLADPEEVMCLQSVMEGNGFYIKAINEQIIPKPGFTVIATANTKGLGDDSGTYVGTNILNEAFLERFKMCREVGYPSKEIESKILNKHAESIIDKPIKEYITKLITWANHIRDVAAIDTTFSHTISTRRLIHILDVYSIFDDEYTSIISCLSRFDQYHSDSFITFYNTLYPSASAEGTDTLTDLQKEFMKQKPWNNN